MNELECPICEEVFRDKEALEWHVFTKELQQDGEGQMYCWCGQDVGLYEEIPGGSHAYERHFLDVGGVITHYHAHMMGAKTL